MSAIYDLLAVCMQQTAALLTATQKVKDQDQKIKDQNADITHLLKHNASLDAAKTALETELGKEYDKNRDLRGRLNISQDSSRHANGWIQELRTSLSDAREENARLLVAIERMRAKAPRDSDLYGKYLALLMEDDRKGNRLTALELCVESLKDQSNDRYRLYTKKCRELKDIHDKAKRRNDRKKEKARRKALKATVEKQSPLEPRLRSQIADKYFNWVSERPFKNAYTRFWRNEIDVWKEARRETKQTVS